MGFFPSVMDFADKHEGFFVEILTLSLAVFTAMLWVSTEKLWSAGEGQIAIARISAEAAKKAAEVAESQLAAGTRPYVVIANPVLTQVILEIGLNIGVSFLIHNIGTTPAAVGSTNVKLFVSDNIEGFRNYSSEWDIVGPLYISAGEHRELARFNHPIIIPKGIVGPRDSDKRIYLIVEMNYSGMDGTEYNHGFGGFALFDRDFPLNFSTADCDAYKLPKNNKT